MSTKTQVNEIFINKQKITTNNKNSKKANIINYEVIDTSNYNDLYKPKNIKKHKSEVIVSISKHSINNKKSKKSKKEIKTVNADLIEEIVEQISFNLTDEDLEKSMTDYCGDLFNYEQLEYFEDFSDNKILDDFNFNCEQTEEELIIKQIDFDLSLDDENVLDMIEKSMNENSMDLFCYEQLEDINTDEIVERSMNESSMDLFCYEQIEDIMDLAEKNMYEMCIEVEFE